MTKQNKRTRREKTREEIGKGNQMTALRFQTGGRHQTSPASLQGELVKHQLSDQRHDSSTSIDTATHRPSGSGAPQPRTKRWGHEQETGLQRGNSRQHMYLLERRENFLLQGRLSVLTLISVSVPPPCYHSST